MKRMSVNVRAVKETEQTYLKRMMQVQDKAEADAVLEDAKYNGLCTAKVLESYRYAVQAFKDVDSWIERVKGKNISIGYDEEG